jgi:hypothetical protein
VSESGNDPVLGRLLPFPIGPQKEKEKGTVSPAPPQQRDSAALNQFLPVACSTVAILLPTAPSTAQRPSAALVLVPLDAGSSARSWRWEGGWHSDLL